MRATCPAYRESLVPTPVILSERYQTPNTGLPGTSLDLRRLSWLGSVLQANSQAVVHILLQFITD